MIEDERTLSDDKLLCQCRVETFRGPGPGGQKKNKTSSAVRIAHLPAGLNAIAGESRSLSRNREVALTRLRLRLAIEVRQAVDPRTFQPPEWFTIKIATRNPLYPRVVGLVIDVLSACDWATGRARQLLGVGSRPFTQFLHDDPEVWKAVQSERSKRNLRPLTAE